MPLFNRDRKTGQELPQLSVLPFPDPKWTQRNLDAVRTMREGAAIYAAREPSIERGAALAEEMLSSWPFVEQQPGSLRDSLAAATTIGYGFGELYGHERRIPKEVYDALQWSALIDTPTEPADFTCALVFACHGGHYVAHEGEGVRATVCAQMNWPEAHRLSARVSVVREGMREAWESISK